MINILLHLHMPAYTYAIVKTSLQSLQVNLSLQIL